MAQKQDVISQIKLQEPTENEWSKPISYSFGGLNFKGQVALTDLKDTSGNPANASAYSDLTRADLYWLVERQGLELATHPLYFEISEGRDKKTKEVYDSVKGDYFVTGSGVEYFGDKAVLGINPIVLDREKGVIRYTHTTVVPRMNSYCDEQNFLDENSWFSKQGRVLKYPIYLHESKENVLKTVVVGLGSGGYVVALAVRRPLDWVFDWGARLMKNLEMEIGEKAKVDKRILEKAGKFDEIVKVVGK